MSRYRGIRKSTGVTQSGIAKALNVSRSTVQRFEYGTSKNKSVAKFYENLQKNADLSDELKQLRTETISRYKELEKAGLENIYVVRELTRDGGVADQYALGESRSKLKREIGKLKKFLGSQTSTVEGYRQWEKNVEDASMRTSGSEDPYENEKFWKLYNEVKNDTSFSKYLKGVKYDSDQLIYDIWLANISLKQNNKKWNAKTIKKMIKEYEEGEL